MGESFKKLKNRTLLAAILKSVTVGLSCGLFVVGILLLAFKLSSTGFFWALYIPIGLGLALISGGLCFFFMRPTDKKIAIKYDAEFGFNEKLQTMVEYGGVQEADDIITLQRQDTLERLEGAPAPKVKFSEIWYYILIAIVSVAVFLSGVLLPPAKPQGSGNGGGGGPLFPGGVDGSFEYTLSMQAEMDDLINAVRDSNLDDETRLYAVEKLEELDENLEDIKRISEMKTEVYGTVSAIDSLIVSTNSFRTLSSDLSELDEDLSNAITKGFVAYKGRLMNDMPQNYAYALQAQLGDYIEKAMESYVTASAAKLLVSQLPVDGSKNLEDTLTEYVAGMDGVLTLSTVAEEDPLYASLKTLNTNLTTIRNQVRRGGAGDSVFWGRIWQDPTNPDLDHDGAFNRYTTSAVDALSVQSYKCVMEVFVRQRLADIFDISFGSNDESAPEELYADIEYTPDGSTGDDPNNPGGNGGGGGIGSGEVIFGSDDMIYYPKTGEMVKFGDVLKEYENAIMNGTVEEDFPPYLAQYLETYLNYLHNGTGKTDE